MKPRAAYPLLSLILAASFYLTVLSLTYSAVTGPDLTKCYKWIGGPNPMYACPDGHSWQKQGDKAVDAGLMTPGVQIPKG